MAVSVAAQARALLGALALGLAAGVLYDLFRVVRVRVRLAFLGPALDLLFWLCCTVAFFLWSAGSGGLVRIYTVILCLAGGWFYFSLVSPACCPMYYRAGHPAGQGRPAAPPPPGEAPPDPEKNFSNFQKPLPLLEKMVYNK